MARNGRSDNRSVEAFGVEGVKKTITPKVEHKTITIKAYRGVDGLPTCASDFNKGQVCLFCMSSRLGASLICNMLEKPLFHDEKREYINPLDGCLVWSAEIESPQ